MSKLEPEKLCLHCMRPLPRPGAVCKSCNFDPATYRQLPHHLAPLWILNGRYLLGGVLGEGGFGITYAAYDLNKDSRVAIKELFIKGAVTRENTRTVLVDNSVTGRQFYYECRRKFIQEAQALVALKDKSGVVGMYELFEENDTAYIVMEYLDGLDLLSFLKMNGGKIAYRNAFIMLRPVMKSMIEIHNVGIIHRDVSPDNIRYLSNRQMKLMDFGSVKFTTRDSASAVVLVKPGYAPYEQYAKNFKVGPWMDVYAMAATIYRCITGKTPISAMDRMGGEELESPIALGADISPEIEEVLMKGMAMFPEDRYKNMWEFYIALKKASLDIIKADEEAQKASALSRSQLKSLSSPVDEGPADPMSVGSPISAGPSGTIPIQTGGYTGPAGADPGQQGGYSRPASGPGSQQYIDLMAELSGEHSNKKVILFAVAGAVVVGIVVVLAILYYMRILKLQ